MDFLGPIVTGYFCVHVNASLGIGGGGGLLAIGGCPMVGGFNALAGGGRGGRIQVGFSKPGGGCFIGAGSRRVGGEGSLLGSPSGCQLIPDLGVGGSVGSASGSATVAFGSLTLLVPV